MLEVIELVRPASHEQYNQSLQLFNDAEPALIKTLSQPETRVYIDVPCLIQPPIQQQAVAAPEVEKKAINVFYPAATAYDEVEWEPAIPFC